MNYFAKKELNKQRAIEHIEYVCKKYPREIADSIENTKVYDESDCEKIMRDYKEDPERGYTVNVSFEKKGIEQAVIDITAKKKSIGVLNFASYKHPGGMFIEGSSAQEESICHSSTLYPVLRTFDESYYEWNRQNKNKAVYKNRALYSPFIIMENDNHTKEKVVSVITIAAPNRGAALKNGVSDSAIYDAMRERIRITLAIANEHNINILVLGAFGCGVFKNDPKVVGKIFAEEVQRYPDIEYIFTIPDKENYDKFVNAFMNSFARNLLNLGKPEK